MLIRSIGNNKLVNIHNMDYLEERDGILVLGIGGKEFFVKEDDIMPFINEEMAQAESRVKLTDVLTSLNENISQATKGGQYFAG